MAEDYVCRLSEASIRKAKQELNEDPKQRMSAVETFRKWIQTHPHIKCPTDTFYLLKFLRASKFSQLRAREMLTGYLSLKGKMPEWFDDIDVMEPGIQTVLKSGYGITLPVPTEDGICVYLLREDLLDPNDKNVCGRSIMRGFYATLIWLNHMDENTTVNGFIVLNDASGYTLRHSMLWTVGDMIGFFKSVQGNYPMRHKGYQVYNNGPITEAIIALAKTVMPAKFKSRFKLHGSNLESVYKEFPPNVLPEEYHPDDYTGPSPGTFAQMHERYYKGLTDPDVRQMILRETSSKWRIEPAKKLSENEPQASFRKLNLE